MAKRLVLESKKMSVSGAVILLASLWFTGCTKMMVEAPQKNEPLPLPSITSTMTGERHQGKIVWHDLLTDDVEAARKFYGDVFGWRFETNEAYTQIFNQKDLIGGMMEITSAAEQKAQAVWLPAMSVMNVDKSINYLESKKGKVLKGPIDMKERGRGALVSDPHGARFVLLHTKNGDPKDVVPKVGDWLWNELWTSAPEQSYAFYRHIGGYDSHESRDGYRILKRKGKWRAGIRNVPTEDLKAHWIPAIRVADLAEILTKVKASDGEILVEPDKDLMNGTVALIADNTGALVIIQYWGEGGK